MRDQNGDVRWVRDRIEGVIITVPPIIGFIARDDVPNWTIKDNESSSNACLFRTS